VESHEERYERVGRLPSEVKVNMAMDMTESMVRVCAEGIRAQYPDITEKELMEKLRERLEWSKRWRKRER
jgi:hypothetical protein